MQTLARISIWLPAARAPGFEAEFNAALLPVLQRHGLKDPSPPDRPSIPGVFGRVFAVAGLEAVDRAAQSLARDPEWLRALERCGLAPSGAAHGMPDADEVPDYVAATSAEAPMHLLPADDAEPVYALTPYRAPLEVHERLPVGPGARQGNWQTYSVEDGLPVGATVTCLHQDDRGHFWVGNTACLSHYDWLNFSHFKRERLQGVVRRIRPDGRAHWLVMQQCVARFDGACLDFYHTADGLPHATATNDLVVDAAGRVWLGSQRGLFRFDAGRWRAVPLSKPAPLSNVRCLAGDGADLWIGTEDGLLRYRDGVVARYGPAEGLPHGSVLSLARDDRGDLWVGTAGGVCVVGDGVVRPFSASGWKPQGQTTAVLATRQGAVWFIDFPYGVCRYEGGECQLYTAEGGLENNQAFCLFEDQQDCLWVGTWRGLSRYEGTLFARFTRREGLAHDGVMDICRDSRGRLFFATWAGLSAYDGGRLESLPELSGKRLWFVACDSRDRLWTSGPGGDGVFCVEGDSVRRFSTEDGLGDARVHRMCVDGADRVWFLHGSPWYRLSKGVSFFDGGAMRHLKAADGLAADAVTCLCEDSRGRMWFGHNQALSRMEGESLTRFSGPAPAGPGVGHIYLAQADPAGPMWFVAWDEDAGWFLARHDEEGGFSCHRPEDLHVAGTYPHSLHVDSAGVVWCGCPQLIYRFDGRAFRRFGREDGLAPGAVIAMAEDERGHMWFGSDAGIVRYDGRVFQTLSRQDGLVHNAVQRFFRDGQGSTWIATEGGVTRYRPSRTRPLVHIRDVDDGRSHGPIGRLETTAAQKLVAIEYQGGSLTTHASRFAYIYRLRGHDDEWRTTYRDRVEFRDLPTGAYIFEIRAIDRDLNYSPPVEVEVRVEPDPLMLAWSQSGTAEDTAFIGGSPALERAKAELAKVADTDLTVLVLGETGTGKGLAARYLHRLSRQRQGPFVMVNCGAIPETLIESELFGHEKGAFTGAVRRQVGKVEMAQGGTLFLDEIGDLPLTAQNKLLHLLQERTFQRVGSGHDRAARVRIIAATNRDLEQMTQEQTFRADLLFRLQVYPINLPPLRLRQEDIALLARHFVRSYARHLDRPEPEFSPEALGRLTAYHWPGNVRELEHLVQRALLNCDGRRIGADDIQINTGVEVPAAAAAATDLPTLVEAEKALILQALERTGGRIAGPKGAAKLLDINPHTLHSRMKKYGLT